MGHTRERDTMMNAIDRAAMLGKVAQLLWEAYPDESIEVGAIRTPVPTGPGVWFGRVMTIRVRCLIDDDRYFAMDLHVDRGATPEGLFDMAREAIADDGPGWTAP